MFTLLLLLACGEKPTPDDSGAPVDSAPTDDSAPAEQDADGDGVISVEAGGEDCDDADPEVFPGAIERCDDVDQDCDGEVDEDAADASAWYEDDDGDGWGDSEPVLACDAPEDHVAQDGDCDDRDATSHPGADETCDEDDNDCDGAVDEEAVDLSRWYRDQDEDGYGDDEDHIEACEGPEGYVEDAGDCDDSDPAYNPGASERDCADPADYNCDGSVGYADADGDGWAACEECDDGEAEVNPDATEVCDDVDNDCDGRIDDADSSLDTTTASRFYSDSDGDGYGDASAPRLACEQPSGTVTDSSDCDDADAASYPGADETCDDADDDCDGAVDEAALDASTWYADADGDGYGDTNFSRDDCDAPANYVADDSDCDDASAAVNPAATEVCNGVDDDCDGDTDPDSAADVATWYADADADGYGDADSADLDCDQPSGFVADDTDCDDADAAIHPGATELWYDGVDGDCDGWDDFDADLDGYASEDHGGEDCDDSDAARYPGARSWSVPGDFSTIQAALDAACPQETISVSAGSYGEALDFNGRAVRLVGVDGAAATVIDAGLAGPVITLVGGEVEGFTLRNGSSADDGGGVTAVGGEVTLSELIIEDCLALDDGGGVALSDVTGATLTDLLIQGNGAGDSGGGLAVLHANSASGDATVTLTRVQVSENFTGPSGHGGGVFLRETGTSNDLSVDAIDLELTDNVAEGRGGGLWSDAVDLDWAGGEVSGNLAGSTGGGVYSEGATLSLDGVDLRSNAGDSAGGLYARSLTLSLSALSIEGNVSDNAYGGVYCRGSSCTLTEVSLIENYAGTNQPGLLVGGTSPTYDLLGVRALGNLADNLSSAAITLEGSGVAVNIEAIGNSGVGVHVEPGSVSDTALLANVSAVGNAGAGLVVEPIWPNQVELVNTLSAFNGGWGLDMSGTYDPLVSYGDLYGNDSGEVTGMADPTGADGNLSVDPGFAFFDADLPRSRWDLHLGGASALIDAGDPSLSDPDGSVSDVGFWGGADADFSWYADADADGPPDGWEAAAGLDTSVDDSADDLDGDGLTNAQEYALGLDPGDRDSDRDGVDDLSDADPLLTELPADASWLGVSTNDRAGVTLLNAGDSDGDGVDELLIGSLNADVAWLVPGDSSGDLDTVALSRFEGDTFGESGAALDFNGDGVPDLALSKASATDTVYVFYGPTSGAYTASSADLSFTREFLNDRAGRVLANLGDSDGDGVDDLLVNAPLQDLGGVSSGAIYVLSGGTASGSLSQAARRAGLNAYDQAGEAADAAGDLDGDGLGDVIVGCPRCDDAGSGSGTTYLLLGPVTGSGDLSSADGQWEGTESGEGAGDAVAGVGDVDADGYDDVLVGALAIQDSRGRAYLLLGPATGTGSLHDAEASLYGEAIGDRAGAAVAGAGDVNADGHADIAIGGPGHDGDRGAVWVLYGPVSGSLGLGQADLRWLGEAEDDQLGRGLNGVGDLDGDGYGELLLGIPYSGAAASEAGEIRLRLGG
ncbi:MAG: VCBS repeat-containing protein [Alphaproteobacteria bacterium]|nr:VCBS repeat-containing protein [Alphaproteobacteria bacterium]